MTTFSIDTSHSAIGFSVRHMVFAKVRGHFTKWTADLKLNPSDLTKSSLEVSIDAASIDTREPQRDGHLKSADFLDAEKYPKITFKSRSVENVGGKNYKVTGDLTIHGVTRDVPLSVEETGRAKDPWGKDRIGYLAKASFERSDFGLKWNQTLEAGGVLVGDRVDVEIDVEAVAEAPKA